MDFSSSGLEVLDLLLVSSDTELAFVSFLTDSETAAAEEAGVAVEVAAEEGLDDDDAE